VSRLWRPVALQNSADSFSNNVVLEYRFLGRVESLRRGMGGCTYIVSCGKSFYFVYCMVVLAYVRFDDLHCLNSIQIICT